MITVMAPLFGAEQDYLKEFAVNSNAVPPYPIDMEDKAVLALKLMFS